jgi:hypothetical protein
LTTIYEIPLSGTPQQFSIPLGVSQYYMRFIYRDAAMGGWCLDIYDDQFNPLICGMALVTGTDLLAQYAYLNIPGQLWVQSDGDPIAVPTFDNLGTRSHVYWVTEP